MNHTSILTHRRVGGTRKIGQIPRTVFQRVHTISFYAMAAMKFKLTRTDATKGASTCLPSLWSKNTVKSIPHNVEKTFLLIERAARLAYKQSQTETELNFP